LHAVRAVATTRETCRICGSRDLRLFFVHDDAPLTDQFVTPQTAGSEFLYPVRVYWCTGCATAQTLHDVEVSEYYREYGYTVSASPFFQRFMRLLAEAAFERRGLRPGDSVIEIGSGDGAQLLEFKRLGANVLGFEPSDELTEASRAAGVPVAQCLFTPETVDEIPPELRPAQAILLTYTFDHLPDPLGFLEAARSALDPERGVLLIEVHDLEKILDRREIALFEHEHSIYLSVRSFGRLLERAGFELLTADLVPEGMRRGNSLLVAAGVRGGAHTAEAEADGRAAALDDWAAYEGFQGAVDDSLRRLAEHVRSTERVAGYGAGGRGVMTLAAAGLTSDDVAYVCDSNRAIHGLLTPKTHIPVASPERALDEAVDEIVVFSFAYMEEIKRDLAGHLERGGRIVSMLDLI
jgi:hypothetical protein